MQSTITIREAEPADIFALAELMIELGYDTTRDEMKVRFENIHDHMDHKTFIAAIDKDVVGMVGLTKNFSYEQNGMYVRVVAIVTRSSFRQKGIGKKLMDVAENWTREIGANKILLNCGNREERAIAHLFYKNIGYEVRSSGFIKKI